MTGVSREDALAFVIDVTNWNFLLKRLVYRYQNLTIAFSSGLRSKQYYSLDGCRDQRAANKCGSFNVVLDLAQSYDLAFLTHLRSIQKRYFYWDDTSYICQQMTKAHMEDFLYLAACSTLCWSLSVFDIVLVVELLMLLMTSVVICAITDDVTVNLHRTFSSKPAIEDNLRGKVSSQKRTVHFISSLLFCCSLMACHLLQRAILQRAISKYANDDSFTLIVLLLCVHPCWYWRIFQAIGPCSNDP
ncbi:hypothetical protein Tco_0504834 [Tanacetum coccineum]